MKSRSLIILVLLSLFVITTISSGKTEAATNDVAQKPDKVYTLRMQAMHPAGTGAYQRLVEITEKIEKTTGGRVQIKSFPAGALVGTHELPKAISDGVIDMGIIASAFMGGIDPGFMLFTTIPGGMGYEEARLWFHFGGGLELLRESYIPHNIHILQPFFGTEEPLMSTVPIRTFDDFKGLSARFPGLGIMVATKMGMSVIDLPIEEHYTSMATGVLDVIDPSGAFEVVFSMGLHEAAPYAILPGWHQPFTQVELAINLAKWNELPDNLKAILEAEFMASAYNDYMATQMAETRAIQMMKEAGVEFIRLPEEEVNRILALTDTLMAERWSKMSPLATKIANSMKEFRTWYASYLDVKTY
jgi:TRAP-type mannitol/chloroaromatic compound transport system substrate-binding protein